MGLFDKLFDKKICDICGGEIGLFGNRKLEDGNCCKDCAKKLSPFFSDRKHSTVEEIREQLEYRKENEKAVEAFNVTKTISGSMNILVDEEAGNFIVTPHRKWREENPDVIPLSSVTGCETNVRELKTEEKKELEDGKSESYNPPRYTYDYDFYARIFVNSPYFDEITVKLNNGSITSKIGQPYREASEKAEEVKALFNGSRGSSGKADGAAQEERDPVICPHCGGRTTPDEKGRCEWCGDKIV